MRRRFLAGFICLAALSAISAPEAIAGEEQSLPRIDVSPQLNQTDGETGEESLTLRGQDQSRGKKPDVKQANEELKFAKDEVKRSNQDLLDAQEDIRRALDEDDQYKNPDKYVPPTLSRKIVNKGFVAPVKFLVGMPVVVAYMTKKEGVTETKKFAGKHPVLLGPPVASFEFFKAFVGGISVAPVFSAAGAWDNRPLNQEDL